MIVGWLNSDNRSNAILSFLTILTIGSITSILAISSIGSIIEIDSGVIREGYDPTSISALQRCDPFDNLSVIIGGLKCSDSILKVEYLTLNPV